MGRAEHTAATVPLSPEHTRDSRGTWQHGDHAVPAEGRGQLAALRAAPVGRAGRWLRCVSGRSPRRRAVPGHGCAEGAGGRPVFGPRGVAACRQRRAGSGAGLGRAFLHTPRGFCLVRETRSGAKRVLSKGFGCLVPSLSSVSRAGCGTLPGTATSAAAIAAALTQSSPGPPSPAQQPSTSLPFNSVIVEVPSDPSRSVTVRSTVLCWLWSSSWLKGALPHHGPRCPAHSTGNTP